MAIGARKKTYLLAGFSSSLRIPHEAMPKSSMLVNESYSCLAHGQQPFRSTSPSSYKRSQINDNLTQLFKTFLFLVLGPKSLKGFFWQVLNYLINKISQTFTNTKLLGKKYDIKTRYARSFSGIK